MKAWRREIPGRLLPVVLVLLLFFPARSFSQAHTQAAGVLKYHAGTPQSDDFPFYFVEWTGGRIMLYLCGRVEPAPDCEIGVRVVKAVGGRVTVSGLIKTIPATELYDEHQVLEAASLVVHQAGPAAGRPSRDALLVQARAAYKQKKFAEAIEFASQAIALDPYSHWAYFIRGDAYDELKRPDLAIRDFDQAVEIKSDFVEGYRYRGLFYAMRGQYSQALKNYNKALEIDRQHVKTYLNRGQLFRLMKENDFACADFHNACRLGDCSGLNNARSQGMCRP
ncbi:MAG: tetratricopeptide repeat protein [Thermodesulfobacteriota bacterium]